MKFLPILTLLTTTAFSAPTPTPAQSAQNLSAINPQQRYYCPENVQDFCGASNVHSGCTFGGQFTSSNMDVCGDCHC